MERKLEADKRELDRDCDAHVAQLESEERAKYEKRVAQMKRELHLQSAAIDVDRELSEFKTG